MKITDIRLRLGKGSEEGGKLKAYVDITFDDSFVIHGLKVMKDKMDYLLPCHQEECLMANLKISLIRSLLNSDQN